MPGELDFQKTLACPCFHIAIDKYHIRIDKYHIEIDKYKTTKINVRNGFAGAACVSELRAQYSIVQSQHNTALRTVQPSTIQDSVIQHNTV